MKTAQARCGAWCCRGALVHNPSLGSLEVLEDMLLVIGPTHQGGTILEICPGTEEPAACSRFGMDREHVVRLEVRACLEMPPFCIKMRFCLQDHKCCFILMQAGQMLCPGFIDLHVHAPQVTLQPRPRWQYLARTFHTIRAFVSVRSAQWLLQVVA